MGKDLHETIREQADQLVENAKHDSVSKQYLIGSVEGPTVFDGLDREYLNRPLISYLFDEEQPHYILAVSDKTGKVACQYGTAGSKIDHYALIAVTDRRVLIVLGEKRGDNKYSIPLSAITDIRVESGLLSHKLVFETQNENKYEVVGGGSKSLEREITSYVEDTQGVMQDILEESHHRPDGEIETSYVCRDCKSSIEEDADRCPHCGFAPKDRRKGGLWHATGLATSFSPIGWAMMAKGAADEGAARQSVGEEAKEIVEKHSENTDTESDNPLEVVG